MILGAMSDENGGAMAGCLAGLFTGGSCLVRLLIAALGIIVTLWLFGAIFG